MSHLIGERYERTTQSTVTQQRPRTRPFVYGREKPTNRQTVALQSKFETGNRWASFRTAIVRLERDPFAATRWRIDRLWSSVSIDSLGR